MGSIAKVEACLSVRWFPWGFRARRRPVETGWSKNPAAGRGWGGGLVSGIIAPDRENRMRLVANRPLQGLARSAPPSPDSIPNNHLSYAVQWFFFAATALVIYALAVRKRLKGDDANGR